MNENILNQYFKSTIHLLLFSLVYILFLGCDSNSSLTESEETSQSNLYDEIYVFGDSLSDAGNLTGLVSEFSGNAIQLPYPFYNNSLSNGKLAANILTEQLGLPELTAARAIQLNFFLFSFSFNQIGNNYAFPGARANASDWLGNLVELDAQIDAYLSHYGISSSALYMIMIGSNDVLSYYGSTTNYEKLTTSIANIIENINYLLGLGARNFFVTNLANLSLAPVINKEDRALIEEIVSWWNNTLATEISLIQESWPDSEIILFDLYEAVDNFLVATKSEDLNIEDPCLEHSLVSFSITDLISLLSSSIGFQYLSPCNEANINSFFFFDELHPTQKVHEKIGQEMYQSIIEQNS